jgi:hypothetical protein
MKCFWLGGEFVLRDVPECLFLVFDGEMRKDVFINEKKVTHFTSCAVWDRQNIRCEITHLVKPGLNRIVVRTRPSPYMSDMVRGGRHCRTLKPNDVEPIALQGRFRVFHGKRTVLMAETGAICVGSWVGQGYPNFGGEAVYTQSFDFVRDPSRRYTLDLGTVRDAAEIHLNGHRVTALACRPFRTEITEMLADGRNCLEIRVCNNWGNLLQRYYHGVSDRLVPAGLLSRPVIIGRAVCKR